MYSLRGVPLTQESAYDYLLSYCRCGQTYHKVSGYLKEDQNTVPVSYDGNCLINSVHGILGRHCRTQLTPSPESLSEFNVFLGNELPGL